MYRMASLMACAALVLGCESSATDNIPAVPTHTSTTTETPTTSTETTVTTSTSSTTSTGTPSGTYAVVAWNDLGMHCMDQDFSVFAILPPYNNLHAQVFDVEAGTLVSEGVSVTYQATADTDGSVNSSSALKTNFWSHVLDLFGVSLEPEMGLAGNPTQSSEPSPLAFDAERNLWVAEGIPAVPVDDALEVNTYPMVKVVVRDTTDNVVAETETVLPVSTEMTCVGCHGSDAGPAAMPAAGWVDDPDPELDWRRNILRLHDERNEADPIYAAALADQGYEPTGLLATADGGQPILCATCHQSNALGTPGVLGTRPLTEVMHAGHADVVDPATDLVLDASDNRNACYSCHPGSTTQCLRGAMGTAKDISDQLLLQCQSCHGNMSKVGAAARQGWVDLPSCQSCHYRPSPSMDYLRDVDVFDLAGNYHQGEGVFGSGAALYKTAVGHGGVQCEACHGATHAEYPSSEPNDNVQSIALQGYDGKLAECSVCHQPVPMTADEGPHGMHTIGQAWVDAHGDYAEGNTSACADCHGHDFRGTFVSATATDRLFDAGDFGSKSLPRGTEVSCYLCHDGPSGED